MKINPATTLLITLIFFTFMETMVLITILGRVSVLERAYRGLDTRIAMCEITLFPKFIGIKEIK